MLDQGIRPRKTAGGFFCEKKSLLIQIPVLARFLLYKYTETNIFFLLPYSVMDYSLV